MAEMSIQVQIEEMPGYLAANFIGVGTVEDAWRQFELIAEQCKRANKNKLLLNFTEYRADVFLHEKYLLVERATIFAHYGVIKIAGVDKTERLDPQKFEEIVALNRGMNARGFTNVEDAEQWLLK
jgi:hypothetical protein